MSKTTKAIRVAYADDHIMVTTAIADNMRHYPQISFVLLVTDGKALIDAISVAASPPDVVLLDIAMNGMDGFQTAAYIKTHWPQIKIIAVSGSNSETQLYNMLCFGASAFISKCAAPQELVKAIEMVHRGEIYNQELFSLASSLKDEQQPDFCAIELAILQAAHEELTVEQLAVRLSFKYKTVEARLSKLYEKIGVKGRIGLLLYALKHGHVSLF